MDVGKRIRFFRDEKNLTAEEFSDLIGVTRGYITKLENDGDKLPSLPTLEKMCEVFGISLSDFFKEEQSSTPELYKLVSSAKQLPTDVLNNLTTMVESVTNHYKTIEKVINGIQTRYTVDLNVKPEGLTEEEELEAQQLFQRLAEIRREKEPKK